MSFGDNWAEDHGYWMKCMACGERTDSDFCSTRCELDYLAREREEKEALAAEAEAETIEPGDWAAEGWGDEDGPTEEEIMEHLDRLP